jgi:Flp pilus assembly protein protease CpaA
MNEYIFLFGLAFVWTVFAVVQDIRNREVSNWLNFSLIGFALAYRAFYSLSIGNGEFFILGFLGFLIFMILGNALYYARAFAGGDAKLLMGYGVILPYGGYGSLLILPLVFLFVLFFVGTIYSLIYSVFLVIRNYPGFRKEFGIRFSKGRKLLLLSFSIGLIMEVLNYKFGIWPSGLVFLFFAIFPFLFFYLRALNKGMTVLKSYSDLQEGDWLERDVKIGVKVIRKSVHGLSLGEIERLKRAKKKVLIMEGIPFTPAFLGALVIMVFFSLTLLEGISFLF